MRRRTRKTVEREPVHDNKTSRRRFHRVYRPRTSPIFSPALEENPIQRVLLYFYPTYVTSLCILYTRTRLYTRRTHINTATYTWRVVRVCVWTWVQHAFTYTPYYVYVVRCMRVFERVCSTTHLRIYCTTYTCVLHDASRDISLRPKKGSRSHREIRIAALYALKDLLYCHLVLAQWTGRLLSDCLATFFPTKEEAGRVVHERERRAGWESNRVSRSPIDWRYRPIFQIRKIA